MLNILYFIFKKENFFWVSKNKRVCVCAKLYRASQRKESGGGGEKDRRHRYIKVRAGKKRECEVPV